MGGQGGGQDRGAFFEGTSLSPPMSMHPWGRTSGTMLRTDVPETIEITYFGQEEILQMVAMGTAF